MAHNKDTVTRVDRRGWTNKERPPKPDLAAISRMKAEQDRARIEQIKPAEISRSETKMDSGFSPVVIDSSHDTKKWTFEQWSRQLAEASLKEIPTKRDIPVDTETVSAIYAAIGRRMQKYLKDGLTGIWANRQETYDKVVSISNKAAQCERLSRRQLFTWLPDVVECFYDDESVHDLFEEMEEAGDKGLSDEAMDDWINDSTIRAATKVMSVVQEDLYETIDNFWSYISGYTVKLPEIERAVMAFKFGASKCDESNFRELELKGLAKCLGSIKPVDYRWVESIEDFRSRAWAIIEERRRQQEVEIVASKAEAEAHKVILVPLTPPKARPLAEILAEFQSSVDSHTIPPPGITPDEVSKLTDPTKLEACSYSTDPDILMATFNNKKTPWSACDRCMENKTVFEFFCKQADGRVPTSPVQVEPEKPKVSDLEIAVTSTDPCELERVAVTTNDPIVRVAIVANCNARKDLKMWLKACNSGLQMTFNEFTGE